MTKRAFQYASRPCLRLDVGRMRERRNSTIFHFSELGITSFRMIIREKAILMLEIHGQNFMPSSWPKRFSRRRASSQVSQLYLRVEIGWEMYNAKSLNSIWNLDDRYLEYWNNRTSALWAVMNQSSLSTRSITLLIASRSESFIGCWWSLAPYIS